MKTIYSLSEIQPFLTEWLEADGDIYEIPGSLLDSYIATGREGYKHVIIREVYLNEWSSGYTVRCWNKLPEKYAKVIDLLFDEETDKAIDLFYK